MSAVPTPAEVHVPRHDVPRGGRSGFTIVEDRQVHYLEWGHGGLPPVLALHGGGQTAYMYEDLGRALPTAPLLAPDLPSTATPTTRDPRGATSAFGPVLIAQTMPPLLEQFGMGRAAVVGASLGGLTSIRL
jgi:pimeloyl-ACP methyl ester carboxylesterase